MNNLHNLDALLNSRAYLQEELASVTSPLIASILLAVALTAILWGFYSTWHKYCYSYKGTAIIVITIACIAGAMFIYSNSMIEYRNISQELTLVETELTDDYDYDL